MSHTEGTTDDATMLSRTETVPRFDSFAPRQGIVRGAGPGLGTETRDLLHRRLRAAAIMLAVGVGAFLVRDVAFPRPQSSWIYFHGLIFAVLVATIASLFGRWRPSLDQLRAIELGLFATIVVCLALGQFLAYEAWVRQEPLSPDVLRILFKNSILGILLVIFTYAIFIPNDWRRAARVIVPMALTPLAAPVAVGRISPQFARTTAEALRPERLAENTLFLLLGAATALYGTHTISGIRSREFRERRLNQYTLGRKLGSGGMGEVYLAEHQLLKRPCAIKLIKPQLSQKPRTLARFELEVRATARLRHWNSVEVWDYGRTEDGTYYYVMEYLPGLSLQQLVDRHGPLPPARVIHLLGHACGALHEAHRMGLIHRDLKPPNIFAAYLGGQYDVAKLLDFGLVKGVAREVTMTLDGEILGTPAYMSPEQARGDARAADGRSDIYGMGAIAYFLLTGRPPFASSDAMEVMNAHVRAPVVAPSRLRGNVPEDLERVVLRCLEKEPDHRYQDAQDLARAFFACRDAADWSPAEAARWWRDREPQVASEIDLFPVPREAATSEAPSPVS
jgi:serine/threonine-protein kinase